MNLNLYFRAKLAELRALQSGSIGGSVVYDREVPREELTGFHGFEPLNKELDEQIEELKQIKPLKKR